MTILQQTITIILCALGTMLTRFLPFLVFNPKKPTPKYIQYLGSALPGAIFGMLVVYCLRGVDLRGPTHGLPELIAAAEAACAEAGVKALVGKIATGDLFVGDSATKAAIEAKCAPDCVEMEGAAVSQIAAKNGVPCVILRAMSDNADEDGHEVLVVKKFSISEYVATATKIVAAMVEKL